MERKIKIVKEKETQAYWNRTVAQAIENSVDLVDWIVPWRNELDSRTAPCSFRRSAEVLKFMSVFNSISSVVF